MSTADLVSRLLEAITETERVAREATEGPWRAGSRGGPTVEAEGWTVASGVTDLDAAHIAHNDPSSVLRRCAADRKLIEHIQDQWDAAYGEPGTVLPHEWATALRILAEAYGLEVTE